MTTEIPENHPSNPPFGLGLSEGLGALATRLAALARSERLENLADEEDVMMAARAALAVLALHPLALREHFECQDRYYSCPKSEDGCSNDDAGTDCDCGADDHNSKVNGICAALSTMLVSAPNVELTGLRREELK